MHVLHSSDLQQKDKEKRISFLDWHDSVVCPNTIDSIYLFWCIPYFVVLVVRPYTYIKIRARDDKIKF